MFILDWGVSGAHVVASLGLFCWCCSSCGVYGLMFILLCSVNLIMFIWHCGVGGVNFVVFILGSWFCSFC